MEIKYTKAPDKIPTLICQECRKPYQPRQLSKVPTSKYCSAHCRQLGNGRLGVFIHAEKTRGTGKGYIKRNRRHEHRIIAESILGRPLVKGEIVHHINGQKKDNRPVNILITTQSVHINLHRTNWRKNGT